MPSHTFYWKRHINKTFEFSSGGTICLQSSHWNNEAFPKPLIFDCVNTRVGLLMHNKVSVLEFYSFNS